MNIKEYISSGILENYVLGLTSDQESREVERLLEQYPEIQEEIRQIENALGLYAEKYAQSPPPLLKEKIWTEIQQSDRTAKPETGSKVIKLSYAKSVNRWLIAASILIVLGTSVLDTILYKKWKDAESSLSALLSEKEYLANELRTQRTTLEQTQNELAFISQPNTKTIALPGVAKFPAALATIYWNQNSKEVYLKVNNLPAPPSDKQYQLWAIVDGKPVSAGVFDVEGPVSLQKMSSFASAQAFAVTLEKKGGSPTPTLEAMYVMGKV